MQAVSFESVLIPSAGFLAREIEDELIIVPLVSGVGDLAGEIYTLNESGRAVWHLLDGRRSLGEIAGLLAQDYGLVDTRAVAADVLGFAHEMLAEGALVRSA